MDGQPVHADLTPDPDPPTAIKMELHQPNLDHIVVRVNHQGRSVDFTLNSFLTESSRANSIRISSHYSYKGIRDFIHGKIGLRPTEPLVFNGTQKVRSRHDLELLIISIQMGITALPFLPELRLPVLILQSEASSDSNRSGTGLASGTLATDTPKNANLHTKRPPLEDLAQPSTKRVKSPISDIVSCLGNTPIREAESVSDGSDNAECSATGDLYHLDDDVDEEGSLQQVEDISSRFALRDISTEDWKRVCRMFQCPEDSREYMPVGFKLAISDYQLHAIWWQITQFPIRGVPGGCLGDEMGLGKTIEVLTVFIIFALIKTNYWEVVHYWDTGKTTDGRMHLPQQQQETDLTCPSQHNSPYGLLCPCVKSGDTFAVGKKVPSLPTICFVRPGSIHGWRREYEKLIDFKSPIMMPLKFSITHNNFREDKRYYHSSNRIKMTTASPTKVELDKHRVPSCSLKGRRGLSNWFLLVSSSGAPALLDDYGGKKVTYRGLQGEYNGQSRGIYDNSTFKINGLAASFVFFDESHTYRASIPGGGPSQLTSIVDHIIRVKRKQEGGKACIGGITTATQLEKLNSDWDYLMRKNHIVSNPYTKAETERRRDSIEQVMKNLVPHILMARRNMDTFRGHKIGENDRQIVLKQIKCNMVDGPGRDAFCELTANVRGYIGQALEERHNAWVVGGRQGPKPTLRSVEHEFFGGTSTKTPRKLGSTWTQLLRTNVYPMVARLYLDGVVRENDMHADSINLHGSDACSLAVSGASREALLDQLGASPFWSHRAQLRDQSSKFHALCKYVEDMVAHRDIRPTTEDPGPADGTNIRHMVVFTDSPVSSFITFMLLSEKYPEIQVMLINGRTPVEATKEARKYGRQEMVDDLMSDCTNDSRNKILVSTYRICGIALNLQRANYCILMEPARDAMEETQAAARVARRGQEMKPVTVRLYDDRNLTELLRRTRHQNQGDIASWQKEGIRWADFV
ncbi:hypothetical protein F5Y06DRAFT_303044 [Hypoxylon sp. FL0890]|nr:hypothetical protein F5Y06DRAFT_303044 [Hypoxylon sp. FL0890]